MICSGCKTDNLAHRRFCSDCGKSLTKNCPRCDFSNALADRYCGGCGESLSLTVRPTVRTQSSVRPLAVAPAPAPVAAVPLSASGEELPPISPQELGELMRKKPSANAGPPPALNAKVSQDDLDKLFGTP